MASDNIQPKSRPVVISLPIGAEAMLPTAQDLLDFGLVEKASAGDHGAVATLVRALTQPIRCVINARLASANGSRGLGRLAIEDLIQDVFLELFAHHGRVLKRWDPKRGVPLNRFVAMIADRHVISVMRTRRVTDHTVDLELVADSVACTYANPEQWSSDQQTLKLLFFALAERLSPLGKRLFSLLFVDELSIDEICQTTGMGADAVYAWRSRLRRRAAELLDIIDPDFLRSA